jgi:3-phenylpropionate/trans-cinnamate dioxygenase ferredoxin reductase subunit
VSEQFDVVIVGAGHAGAQAAVALRQHGFLGTVALIGDEPEPPYERPPLSKEYLKGDKPFERLLIRPRPFWAERRIELVTGTRVTAVAPDAHEIATEDGRRIGYGTLVWATGGAPRRLTCDGHDLAGLHTIRTRADVDRLGAELDGALRAVVIGGGYIGLEAAAVLTQLGKRVTVVEALNRVLARVAGEPLSRYFEGLHRGRGVELILSTAVRCVAGEAGRVVAVDLDDGRSLPCDIVVVGIGIEPAVAPLFAAGAAGGNGVAVDAHGRTSLPDIFAIGDCALHANPFAQGREIRLESVQNANDMAGAVARTLTGTPTAYHALPWFWSNQYEVRLQTAGLSTGHDRTVMRGNPAAGNWSLAYLRAGRLIAIDCVNAVKDYAQARALILSDAPVDEVLLADPAVPLREVQKTSSDGESHGTAPVGR